MQAVKNNIITSIRQWFKREVIERKFISPVGIIIMSLFAAIVAYSFTNKDYFLVPFIISGALIGLIVLFYCLFRPLTGFYIVMTIAFFAFYPGHLLPNIDFPISTGVEILILFVFIGSIMYSKKAGQVKGGLINTSVSVALILYSAFLFSEMFNPNVSDLSGWIFTFKRYLVYLMVYVIAYNLIDTPEKFRYFLKYWINFSFVAALYGCYQHWFGYLPMEMNYIQRNPLEYKLLHQGGSLRNFSFLSDVVSFGVLAGSMAVLTLLLAVNEKVKKRKRLYWFFTIIMTLGMLYSGTRTTNIMLPAGLALYILLTIQNKRTMIILFFSFMVVFLILFLPIDNATLNRIRSTFNSKEASLNVRDMNRHYIQPYIYAHPFGGGVATSGTDGLRFYPHHPLAGFPPDSGFLKVALEQGWLGLALTILYNMMILYQGVYFYFRMRQAELKKYMVVILAALFSIFVTQYAQVSVGQLPQALFIFACMSLIKRLMEFDEEKTRLEMSENELQVELTN